jgi:hypothetical protein
LWSKIKNLFFYFIPLLPVKLMQKVETGINQPRCSNHAAGIPSIRLSQNSSHQPFALKMCKENIGFSESLRQLAPGISNRFCGIDFCALSISPDPIGYPFYLNRL